MADVVPLKPKPSRMSRGPAHTQPPATSPLEMENLEVLAHLEDLVGGRLQFDLVDSDEYIEGYIKGIHPLILERLRQGLFSVQGHLDLHGLTVREAETAVRDFIETAAARNQRCVLLVHGRGINSKDHIPVLKRRLEILLLKSSIRKKILAFTSARPHDGGTGASYLLLRTRR
jgi:DNA-nicking Smr family endonuclease